jgi:hypothetical protein
MPLGSSNRKIAWLVLLMLVLAGFLIAFIPAWIIQPFKPQTSQGVAWSYGLRSWAPVFTVLASLTSVALIAWLWKGTRRWWRKAALVVIVLPLFLATWFARQNHFEWMFHPLPNPAYAKVNEASFVADADMVMAVEAAGEAVAYPVRLMAYHHVVMDVVGGTPIVATY